MLIPPTVGCRSTLLILERNSIPYSFKITAETRITVGMRKWPAIPEDLEVRKGHWATVKFRVTGDGNIAQEISVRRGPPVSFHGSRTGLGIIRKHERIDEHLGGAESTGYIM